MKFAEMPFVKCDAEGNVVDPWSVQPTDDYAENCRTGRRFFGLLLFPMRLENNPLLIGTVTQAIVMKGKWTGIEVGFIQAMSEEISLDR